MKKNLKLITIILIVFLLFTGVLLFKDRIYATVKSFKNNSATKTLIVGRSSDSISLDPVNTTEMDSVKVTVNIYETLVKYEKEGTNIIPCLAESWKSTEDGLTWRFKLRRGVKFHDGTSFNADAVVFNFERWMNEDNPYHKGEFSYWNYVFSGFPGFITSVKALSNYEVEIKLAKPYAPFLNSLVMPVFAIQSPKSIKDFGEDLYKHPVGTGPFCFKSWEPNKEIILERNENYWQEPALVDVLKFKVIPSGKERYEMLKKGEIHIADNLRPEDVEKIEGDPELKLYLRPSFNVGYLALNNEKPPLDNRLVRRAISHCINKEEMIREVFANIAKPAKTFIPPTLWGYNESLEAISYDPQKAIELLREAGYPNGFKTKLWVMDASRDYFPKPYLVAEYIKESLRQINIEVEIETYSWDEYLDRVRNGEHKMALIGWTGDSMDPDNFLNTILASENAKPGIAGNHSMYKNSEVDTLLTQARQTNNVVFRKELYRRLLNIVNDDMPSIPLVHTMPVVGTQKSVMGYAPFITGVESLENVDLVITQ